MWSKTSQDVTARREERGTDGDSRCQALPLTLFRYDISASPGRTYSYLCILVEETEAREGCVTCRRPHRKVASWAVISILPDANV